MKVAGFLLLLAGWIIVVSAVAMFSAPLPRAVFIIAGICIEAVGLALALRSHLLLEDAR